MRDRAIKVLLLVHGAIVIAECLGIFDTTN